MSGALLDPVWSNNTNLLKIVSLLRLKCPDYLILRFQNPVYCWPGGACWAAGQCGAERPVMCGAGLPVRCWCGAVVDGVTVQGRALGLCSPGAAAVHAGLSRGGCSRGGIDLGIGSGEYFDHTGRTVVIINLVTVLMERTSLMEWTSSVTSMTISIATRQNASKSWRQRMPG